MNSNHWGRWWIWIGCLLLGWSSCDSDGSSTRRRDSSTSPGIDSSSTSCGAKTELCGNECVNTDVDRRHCGGCDQACIAGQICNGAGSCALSCQAGLIECESKCVDPSTNRDYCGASDNCLDSNRGAQCAAGEVCSAGTCRLSCQQGLIECEDLCVNPLTDRQHCGGCAGVTPAPDAGPSDAAPTDAGLGDALPAADAASSDAPPGDGGAAASDLGSVDAAGDAAVTGGQRCDPGELCNLGRCQPTCSGGLLQCGDSCVDPETNRNFCGASGDCQGENSGEVCGGGETCSEGQCGCASGYVDEEGSCINTKQVPCTDNAPANATSTPAEVPVYYNEVGGWTTPADCAWTCDSDYAEENGACINSKQVPCTDNPVPNATSIADSVTVTYTTAAGWSTPADCAWACNLGYWEIGGVCRTLDTCEQAGDISAGGTWIDVVDTRRLRDLYNDPGACSMAASTEAVFLLTVPDTRRVVISTEDSSFDTVLFVKTACDNATASLYCNDDMMTNVLQSRIDQVFTAGTYYVFVDGWQTANGLVTLSVSYPDLPPDPSSTIAFASNRDGDYEILIMGGDGTNATQLTSNTAWDYCPSRSADGSKIAFASNRDGNLEIYIMDADGSNVTRLTNEPTDDGLYGVSLAPDASRVAFHSDRSGNRDVWVVNTDGSGSPLQLTTDSGIDQFPAFSPDGSEIVFVSNRGSTFSLWIKNADGSGQARQLTTTNSWYPAWSPDGNQIAYHSGQDVWVSNADGSGTPTRITTDGIGDDGAYGISYSRDGSRIAFTSDRAGNYDIFSINVAGGGLVNLTDHGASDRYPSY